MTKDVRDFLIISLMYVFAFIGFIATLTYVVSYIHDHIWLYNQLNP